ncbi:MAG TPA: carboxypeptidase-like regulatory domain-containing protein, partial [Planctomycetota bacterium]|nr:carboxypeptidase-like regulatory domain-containing protein [Planctomycetota bacterium]
MAIRNQTGLGFGAVLCVFVVYCAPVEALVRVGGAEPVRDAGWPVGALEMANLPTRFAWYEGPPFGGGDWHFQYRCNGTAQFNDALQTFSRILWPRLELIVVDGMGSVLGKADEPVDWEFQVWVPESFYRLGKRRSFRPESSLPPPRITAYLGKGSMIEWAKVQVPANVSVIDKRVETSPWKDSQGGVVRVTAYDMTNGKVIPDVDLELKQYEDKKWNDKYAARTGEQGTVVIRNIAPGYYYITLRCSGYATRTVQPGYRNYERTLGTYDVLLSPAAS